MPRKAREKSKSGTYHIMLRGANRQEIYHDDVDCMKFLEIVEKYKATTEIKVYAWCLMNNHVHLLLKEGNEEISTTMKRIGVSYVVYYNNKYATTGHLFQDRFRSENVETSRYLLTVTRYIHQNPVKAGIVNQVDGWRWSSCLGYYGNYCFPKNLLDKELVLGMFSTEQASAVEKFKLYNETKNDDDCLDEHVMRRRKTDEEARIVIKQLLGTTKIQHVKSLPKEKRTEVFQKIKELDGVSQRQAARILGVSVNLIFKA
ncbi:REP element-mobilizing transposase RayT [Oceanobacillus limi]|uniref:REP element-mobilizing transposase RayT n=1 Tax=Oceanobacillus limi TaxID=930131 RepID=A0A1I0A7Z8_9BACI|nr:transposase [Oceanobacillus limi]SES89808.1 REP element-mobilizing transposase RayT [Oceanobacillus limi]